MIESIHRFVKESGLLQPGDRVVVAVSGGADSVALLHALLLLRERLGIAVAVAHFNHRLRGEASDADAQFVENLAARHSLPFHLDAADVREEARRQRRNLEATARELRYRFLRALVERGEARKAATGHTADDQAETVLARLLRGSGTRGLAGIYPVVDGWLVRPLLGQRRAALRDWLAGQGVEWREDASNLDDRFTRNRIRRAVLPLLESYNPRLVENLCATAGMARDEEEYWRAYLDRLLPEIAEVEQAEDGQTVLKLHVAGFVQLSRAEQRRVLHGALARLGLAGMGRGVRLELDRTHVEALRRLAVSGRSGQRTSLGAWQAVRVFDRVEIRRRGAQPAEPYEYRVDVPGACDIPALRTRLVFNLVGRGESKPGYNHSEAALVDLASVHTPLVVRNWRPGDVYDSPSGQGKRKIKRLLLERRVPADERRLWPVVVSGPEVVWMRGFPVARPFRIQPTSAAGILIREEGLADE